MLQRASKMLPKLLLLFSAFIVCVDCQCNTGFTVSGNDCVDINECDQKACNTSSTTCTNTVGSYYCTCKPGFLNLTDGACTDVDECSNNPCSPENLKACENNAGSFDCVCNTGYVTSGTKCIDENECVADPCNVASTTCTNTIGSYYCSCKNGYLNLQNQACTDVDECINNPCNGPQVTGCENTAGSFRCLCAAGYKSQGTSCVDIDECANNALCNSATSVCTNKPGSFTCACKPGYEGLSRGTCTEKDECHGKVCDADGAGVCLNIIASYQCLCQTGVVVNGAMCSVVPKPNELKLWEKTKLTIQNGWVKNPSGSHAISKAYDNDLNSYALNDGPNGWFMFQITSAKYIAFVSVKDGSCCVNSLAGSGIGMYTAFDPAQKDTFISNNNHGMLPSTTSADTFVVMTNPRIMKASYVSIQKTTPNKMAISAIGFYSLLETMPWDKLYFGCQKGYTPETEVFEVKSLMECFARCYTNKAVVTKIVNGSKCFCDNKHAELLPSSACNVLCREGGMFCGGVNAISVYGSGTTTTDWPFNFHTDSYNALTLQKKSACHSGWNGDMCHIKDCSINNGQCGKHKCVTFSIGTASLNECECLNHYAREKYYYAQCTVCKPGFVMNGAICTDIDECANEAFCNTTTSTCTNTLGSFSCTCKPGYHKLMNGACTEIDECASNPCGPTSSSLCENFPGSFRCSCRPGYRNESSSCRDVNECESSPCPEEKPICTNSPGSYRCTAVTVLNVSKAATIEVRLVSMLISVIVFFWPIFVGG